jgi:hypothetical protein
LSILYNLIVIEVFDFLYYERIENDDPILKKVILLRLRKAIDEFCKGAKKTAIAENL